MNRLFNRALRLFIRQINRYDTLRLTLEKSGGQISDINRMADILREELLINGKYNTYKVALMDHSSIYSMLNDIGDLDLHLDIRQLDSGMPIYYLCRTYRDYWAEYSMIVEDIYKSPGYPTYDKRFVKLMFAGHEAYYLRLSHFRTPLANTLKENKGNTFQELSNKASNNILTDLDWFSTYGMPIKIPGPFNKEIDEILYNIGRRVFQSAWHEDQRLGLLVADHFGLEIFRYCIELLYLCLSSELCSLRAAVDEQMLIFFDKVYPQPAILRFLKVLTKLDGKSLTLIPQKALDLFTKLSRALSHFLGIEVEWGAHKAKIPLYKLIYGNFSRLNLVEMELKNNDEIHKGTVFLETEAKDIIREIIN